MSDDEQRLPLKVVPPLENDYISPNSGGGSDKIFVEPTEEFRNELIRQVQEVKEYFANSFQETPEIPAVARVRLRHDAIAKSHRPTRLFVEETCPIIGSEGLGGLLVSVTPDGLENLTCKIESDRTKKGRANLSTLREIKPFQATIRIPTEQELPLKVKLFRHRHGKSDLLIEGIFKSLLQRLGDADYQEVTYGPGLKIFRIGSRRPEVVQALSRFIGTQSVSGFPVFRPVRTCSLPVGKAVPSEFPLPDPNMSYPVVGLIDSGICPDDKLLAPWIVGREEYVPPEYRDYAHGTFVGGLLVHSRRLNHGDPRFPGCSSKIVDVVALPSDGITEDELVALLRDVIPKYPDVKYWNLSLGGNCPVSDDIFSDFAVALDEIQREYGVVFVLAGGNCSTRPLPLWSEEDYRNRITERICAPADSVRSLVVGSVAHVHNTASASPNLCPSPFTRIGPGPAYLPKPDLSHYGGNCKSNADCSQTGVMSFGANQQLVEDIGTSFAAPMVTTLAANISHGIVGVVDGVDEASLNMTKALLVHSAAWESRISDPCIMHYRGFGTPPDLSDILSCPFWACTLVFELPVVTGYTYQKTDFPIPPSLVHDGVLKAEFLMTLVYDPELDASYGSEYCRSNVEVSLGTLRPDEFGKYKHHKEVPEEPRLRGSAYESELVKYGFKWSPVKVYRRKISSMKNNYPWRLAISINHRAGDLPTERQPAALVITLADPGKQEQVYSEMVRSMNNLGWGTLDLQLHPRIRP